MLMLRRILTLHNLVFALVTVASGQLVPQSPSVHRGDVETVKGSIPQGVSTIAVRRPGGIPSSDIPLSIRTQSPAEFTFIVVSSKPGAPFNGIVPFGRYDLVLKDAGDKELPDKLQTFIDVVPGDVHLNSVGSFDPYPQPPKDAKGQVVKDAKGKEGGEYAIYLEGSGFSDIPTRMSSCWMISPSSSAATLAKETARPIWKLIPAWAAAISASSGYRFRITAPTR